MKLSDYADTPKVEINTLKAQHCAVGCSISALPLRSLDRVQILVQWMKDICPLHGGDI